MIYSKHDCGVLKANETFDNGYYFEHFNNQNENIILPEKQSNKIIVSYSTITSAIHIGAYMGAKNIIICGHDCGTINGKSNYLKYYKYYPNNQNPNAQWYKQWLKIIESQTILTKKYVKEN